MKYKMQLSLYCFDCGINVCSYCRKVKQSGFLICCNYSLERPLSEKAKEAIEKEKVFENIIEFQ